MLIHVQETCVKALCSPAWAVFTMVNVVAQRHMVTMMMKQHQSAFEDSVLINTCQSAKHYEGEFTNQYLLVSKCGESRSKCSV